MTLILEREVVIVSNDGKVRSEVSAVVAQRPGARAVFAEPGALPDADVGRAGGIVVIDDEGQQSAVELIHHVKGRRQDASIVYLAANHSAALESEVRRAGASFYAVKSSRDGDLTRVIEVLLAR